MKKYLLICVIAFSILACENEINEFPDFGSTSVYFPFQTPIRTLIQGKYDLGFNENDNNGRFEIGVTMTGVYNNNIDRKVHFELAPDLIDAAALGLDTVNVEVLPSSYYTIEQESPVTIPSGSISGRIPVQLSDAFFDDPKSFAEFGEVHYVIPLKITNYEQLDSLLVGLPTEGVTNPIRIKADDWQTEPKDYTLFGIKYMNKYQGIYLRRGEDKVVGTSQTIKVRRNSGQVEESGDVLNIDASSIYRAENIVQDELDTLFTSGRSKALVTNPIRRAGDISNTSITLELTFDSNENISIKNADENSEFIVTGSGKFVENGDEWGGKKQDVIYLEYTYQDKVVETSQEGFFFNPIDVTTTVDLFHTVNDTLVIRDRDVKFEEFVINLEKNQ